MDREFTKALDSVLLKYRYYAFWLLFLYLTYLICSSCQCIRSWTPRRFSHGHCRSLDTHRGPKSPAKASTLLLVGGTISSIHTVCLGGLRVPNLPRGSGEPTYLWRSTPHLAKPSGLGPTPAHLEHQRPQHKKKSYIRALKRAHLHGHTWYRGQLFTAATLGVETLSPLLTQDTSSSTPTPNVTPPAKIRKNHLTGFCWNICSRSNYKFDVLRQWMLSQHLDIMLLQDTRWGFSGDWSDTNYAYIHSGSTGKPGGTMIIIRKGFCNLDRISWRAVVPGRLLHARLYLQSTGLDILSVYQYAWIQNDPTCIQHRKELLHACDQLADFLKGT